MKQPDEFLIPEVRHHVFVLMNHDHEDPDMRFWRKEFDVSFHEYIDAQDYAQSRYHDRPIRIVSVIWHPEIVETREVTL